MKPSFDIRSDQLKKLSVQFEKISRKVNYAAHDGLNKCGIKILAEAQRILRYENHSYVTGQLFKSGIVRDVRVNNYVEVLFDSDHAANVEFGQKAGTNVEPKTLVEWLKRKHIIGGEGRKGYLSHLWAVATVISKNIRSRGTKPQPFLFPAFRKNEQEVIEILQREINKVTR